MLRWNLSVLEHPSKECNLQHMYSLRESQHRYLSWLYVSIPDYYVWARKKKLLHCEIVCGETNLCLSLLIVALLFNSNYASDLHLSTHWVVLRRCTLICLVTLDVNRILIVGATCVETTVNIISHQVLIFFPFFPLMDKMQMNDCDLILALMWLILSP